MTTGTTTGSSSTTTGTTGGASNANPPSSAVLVDDFSSGDGTTQSWGHWEANVHGGGNSDGTETYNYSAAGYSGNGGLCGYTTDSGSYSFTQQNLYFPQSTDISMYKGVYFRMKGTGLPTISLALNSPLATGDNYWAVWQSTPRITPEAEWTAYTVRFSDFVYSGSGNTGHDYSLQDALQGDNGLSWGVTFSTPNTAQTGSFTLDDVYFLTE